jgi:hypothetical protein
MPDNLEIETKRQIDAQRRARYKLEADNGDGRPSVNKFADDPLLELLKEGKR